MEDWVSSPPSRSRSWPDAGSTPTVATGRTRTRTTRRRPRPRCESSSITTSPRRWVLRRPQMPRRLQAFGGMSTAPRQVRRSPSPTSTPDTPIPPRSMLPAITKSSACRRARIACNREALRKRSWCHLGRQSRLTSLRRLPLPLLPALHVLQQAARSSSSARGRRTSKPRRSPPTSRDYRRRGRCRCRAPRSSKSLRS